MPILGSAVARYLSHLRGLYSVELPFSLSGEMAELVDVANTVELSRALFVSSSPEEVPTGFTGHTPTPRLTRSPKLAMRPSLGLSGQELRSWGRHG